MTGIEYALQAQSEKYTGIPYAKLDCQGFVEEVLKDCGVRRPNGSCYNWKGSNSMWRNALRWKGSVSECKTLFGCIPMGAWLFIVKHDGGEIDRGYHDNEGNASHVAIYCRQGSEPVRDSTKTKTRDGVGYRKLEGFTHVGLPFMLDYDGTDRTPVLSAIHTLRDSGTSDSDFLSAIETISAYLKGV